MQQQLKLIVGDKQTPVKTKDSSQMKIENPENDMPVNNFKMVVAGLVPDIEVVKEHSEPAIMTPNSNIYAKIPTLQALIEANMPPADVSQL